VVGGIRGVQGVFVCQTRLKLSDKWTSVSPCLQQHGVDCRRRVRRGQHSERYRRRWAKGDARTSPRTTRHFCVCVHRIVAGPIPRDVAAQIKFESILECIMSHSSFKRSVPGAFNLGFIGSTGTTLP